MLSRTERIDEFQLKVTRAEKELYEEFLKNENLIRRSKEAILHRMRILLAKTIRESLGRK